MDYDALVRKVAKAADHPEETVRAVLGALPEVLMKFKVGDSVQTPWGTFIAKLRKPKRVKTLGGNWVMSSPRFAVTLRSGKQLVRPATDDEAAPDA